jgi:hypothetical protein
MMTDNEEEPVSHNSPSISNLDSIPRYLNFKNKEYI